MLRKVVILSLITACLGGDKGLNGLIFCNCPDPVPEFYEDWRSAYEKCFGNKYTLDEEDFLSGRSCMFNQFGWLNEKKTDADIGLVKEYITGKSKKMDNVFEICSKELDLDCGHPDTKKYKVDCEILNGELEKSYRFFLCGVGKISEICTLNLHIQTGTGRIGGNCTGSELCDPNRPICNGSYDDYEYKSNEEYETDYEYGYGYEEVGENGKNTYVVTADEDDSKSLSGFTFCNCPGVIPELYETWRGAHEDCFGDKPELTEEDYLHGRSCIFNHFGWLEVNGTEADLQLIKDFMIETDLEDVFDECSEELDRGCDHPDSSDFASTCHILGDELTRSYRFFHCGIETITEMCTANVNEAPILLGLKSGIRAILLENGTNCTGSVCDPYRPLCAGTLEEKDDFDF